MTASFLLLVLGVLCALWDQALGRRLNQGDTDTWRQRLALAWAERRATLVGSVLVLVAAVLEVAGA